MSRSVSRLALESVVHEWRGRAGVTRVLDGVDFEVHAGEFVTVAGPSGAGKTTLLSVLGALTRPTDGRVFVGSTYAWGLSENERTELRRESVAFVLQRAEMISSLSVVDNVALPALARGVAQSDAIGAALAALESVALGARAHAHAFELSGGEARRAALARAVVSGAPFLLADEPTGDLDADSAGLVEQVLLGRAEAGCGIVVVTHDPKLAARGSRRLTLKEGRLADAR